MRVSDRELVVRCLGGDPSAFGLIVDKYWPQTIRVMRSILADTDAAEDATQEAFIAAHRRLEELREPDKLAAWLGAIARNVARKHLRQHKLEQERFGRDREVVEALATTIGAPDQEFSYENVRTAVRSLAPPDRYTIVLFYFVGLKIERIADELSVPIGTVKSRLNRARKQLRERMENMAEGTQENYKMRDVIGGMDGKINWHKLTNDDILASWRLAGNTAVATAWKKEGNAIIGDDGGRGDAPILVSDASNWSDFELSLLLTPISGGNAQVAFRLSETGSSYYLFDMLLGWKAIAISRVIKGHLTKLSVVNFPVELGQEYEVQIAARGASFTSYIDGKLVNQVTDENIRSGAIALIVWEGKVAFRDFRFRHLH